MPVASGQWWLLIKSGNYVMHSYVTEIVINL